MQTCLWIQGIWIYNHLISISKYTHQISTSLILIFSFSDWNNGWRVLSKKQKIILFGFFYLKGLQWLFESEMQKFIFSPQNKGSQHFCTWLQSYGTDGSHFLFSPDFLLRFPYSANPVQIKSCLYHLRAAGTWPRQEHFQFSMVGNWARLPQAEWEGKILTHPVLGLDRASLNVIRSVQDRCTELGEGKIDEFFIPSVHKKLPLQKTFALPWYILAVVIQLKSHYSP